MASPAVKTLVPLTTLTTAAVQLYVVPSPQGNSKAYIRGVRLANFTAGAISVSLYVVPSGVGVANQYLALPAVSVPANTAWEMTYEESEWPLGAAEEVWAKASANTSVNISMAGAEQA